MHRLLKLVMIGTVAISLAACQSSGPKQTGGTLLGAAGGGLLGSQVGSGRGQLIAVGVGVLLGALIGSEVGKSLDRADRAAMSQTTQRALENSPDYDELSWNNPNSRNSGTIKPVRTWERSSGNYCREYQQTITVGGKTQQAYGHACRQPDGQWKIINK